MNKINKPRLSLLQIINMSFGFLGIQFGFNLQSGNASRILLTYGADLENLSFFWLAAPLTGMIIQPIIGYYSDKTWGVFGRRKPYFLIGAILAAISLIFMPNASLIPVVLPFLYIGAGMLMIMDASFNVAMEPFRALVADNLPEEQNTLGFSVQTCLIGIGAVAGSALPKILADNGVASTAAKGIVPDNLIYSFYVGAAVFVFAILWTVLSTKEYSPLERTKMGFEPENGKSHGFSEIVSSFKNMPSEMKQLGIVQFCSWIALFSMWLYSTSAIAHHVYGTKLDDKTSELFNEAGNMTSFLGSFMNGTAAIYAIALPFIASYLGKRGTHALSLICGGIGFFSIYFVHDPSMLKFSMIGIGMAWASILAMPYAILANAIPINKMGIYMGIFNFFITFPQIVHGLFGGVLMKFVYGGNPIYAMIFSGIFMILGAFSVMFVKEQKTTYA
jgi:maltose/moltooligosaccharide transporter